MTRDATEPEREHLFLDMLSTHGPRLQRIAWSYARGPDRDDLYQEILCQVWRSLPAFRGEASLGTWVYRIALNTAMTHARMRRRRPVDVRLPDEGFPHLTTTVSAGREDAILTDFLGTLGDVDRSVLILYLDGLSHQQMADVTGMSAGAVAVRLHRIKRRYSARYLE